MKLDTLLGPDSLASLATELALASSFEGNDLQEAEAMNREVMMTLARAERTETIWWFMNLHNLATNLHNQGRLKESEDLYTEALAGKQKILGSEHPSTLLSMVGIAACTKGDNDDLLREALRLQEKVLGLDHNHTLSTASPLAVRLRGPGRLAEAEELFSRVLQGNEKALGPKQPATLMAVFNLAKNYRAQRN